ncbi:MAG: rod shape-determining protein MreD [Candidatus Obscuribacterales bacterium]|nr:rod shape-determining protein MreD [Cyanobacteria bacterium SZAS LIN-5]RTL44848.1 MAG: rod shape-determining protein MreD [Candidatus Melainabacteria bacterium]
MALMSVRTQKRIGEIGITALVVCFAWLIQLTVFTQMTFNNVLASLPLTFTILWGSVFGSPLQAPRPNELRISTLGQVIARQALSGSLSGALVGAFFGALFASVIPAYPIAYPLIGWIAGYFTLQNFNQATFLCIPLVFFASIFAETVTALQLAMMGRPDVLQQLSSIAFPEAILNALMAPFIFFPMREWYKFSKERDTVQST